MEGKRNRLTDEATVLKLDSKKQQECMRLKKKKNYIDNIETMISFDSGMIVGDSNKRCTHIFAP